MKFENPIMNISMFEVENVVTTSTPVEPEKKVAVDAAKAYLNGDENVKTVFVF